jgi:hypothetical protein
MIKLIAKVINMIILKVKTTKKVHKLNKINNDKQCFFLTSSASISWLNYENAG